MWLFLIKYLNKSENPQIGKTFLITDNSER